MKIVIAPDSFKGSLSAKEVSNNIEIGIRTFHKDVEVIKVPMADGGEGTLEVLIEATNGRLIETTVKDPLFRDIRAQYGILGNGTAIIEMSRASGLALLKDFEKNPMETTTYGTGELILNALNAGCRSFIIGLGGSATNDCGVGMLAALGVKFYDKINNIISLNGKGLYHIDKIDITNLDPRIKESSFIIATDVDNELSGINGAAYVYGPQKGATILMVQALDRGLENFAYVVRKQFGIDIENTKGAGAAGGLGGGILGFLNGQFIKGIDMVIDETKLEETIKDADLVITGEGKMDFQTQFGKTPYGVAKLAGNYNIPVVAICGSLGEGYKDLYKYGFTSIFSIINKPMTLEECIIQTPELLQDFGGNIIRLITSRSE